MSPSCSTSLPDWIADKQFRTTGEPTWLIRSTVLLVCSSWTPLIHYLLGWEHELQRDELASVQLKSGQWMMKPPLLKMLTAAFRHPCWILILWPYVWHHLQKVLERKNDGRVQHELMGSCARIACHFKLRLLKLGCLEMSSDIGMLFKHHLVSSCWRACLCRCMEQNYYLLIHIYKLPGLHLGLICCLPDPAPP